MDKLFGSSHCAYYFVDLRGSSFENGDLRTIAERSGGEVLNDATVTDALYTGIDRIADIISNGLPIAGTVYELLPDAARESFDAADVILAKGQGNYESLRDQGFHIFYSFLCKCSLFTDRFQVPAMTGMFIEE